ncbi:MAG: ribosome maturation factor RimP [Granulosicoccus sp.]|nr:ribosome maturation factor RimP [Granulosicoccus sp.]
MQRASTQVVSVIEPVVSGLGYELVGAEFGQAENGMTLRVYIDKPEGIVMEDCATVSRQLDAVLDVEDTIKSAYLLEVSSPGIDRPLFTEAHFAAQIGEEVKVRLADGIGGRRNFKGQLVGVEDGVATVEVDGTDYELSIADVEQAHVKGRLP